MALNLFTIEIRYENDVVLVRQKARTVAAALKFDAQDQTRIATAVSEIARNAFQYGGGGRAEFSVTEVGSQKLLTRARASPILTKSWAGNTFRKRGWA
jgi:anti-sigma regulatory factor (Ser/Thr protein kinase)